jgi:hypothetical protein
LTRRIRSGAARAKLLRPHAQELDQLDRPMEGIRDRGAVLEPDGGHDLPINLRDEDRRIRHARAVALGQSPQASVVARLGEAEHDRPHAAHGTLLS